MRIVFALFLCIAFPALSFAQATPFSVSFGVARGFLSITKSTGNDRFFIGHYSSSAAIDMACRYKLKSNWEFGMFLNLSALYINGAKSSAGIIASEATPGFLYKASASGNMQTQQLGLEVSKIFKFKKFALAPFFRSSYYYNNRGRFNISLKEKIENEHYYKETNWVSSDTEYYYHFAPLILAAGVRLIYNVTQKSGFYLAAQYHSGSLGFKAIKTIDDFNNQKTLERVNYKQRYGVLGMEIGYKYTFSTSKKSKEFSEDSEKE